MSKNQPKICSECENELDDDTEYCTECGSDLSDGTISGEESSDDEEDIDIEKQSVTFSSLPKIAKDAVYKRVKGLKINDIIIEKKGGMVVYNIEGHVGDTEYVIEVTEKGKIISYDEERDEETDESEESDFTDSEDEYMVDSDDEDGLDEIIEMAKKRKKIPSRFQRMMNFALETELKSEPEETEETPKRGGVKSKGAVKKVTKTKINVTTEKSTKKPIRKPAPKKTNGKMKEVTKTKINVEKSIKKTIRKPAAPKKTTKKSKPAPEKSNGVMKQVTKTKITVTKE